MTTPPSGWGPQPDGETYIPPPPGSYPPPQFGGYPPPGSYPQPYGALPPYQAPRRRRGGTWWKVILGVVLLLIIIGELGSRGSSSTPNVNAVAASSGGSLVTYEITGGQATAGNVTYGTEGFQTEQISGVALPWRHDVQFTEKVDEFSGLSVLAQNGPDNSEISCAIFVDGQQVATGTSSGPYSIVTCNGHNA